MWAHILPCVVHKIFRVRTQYAYNRIVLRNATVLTTAQVATYLKEACTPAGQSSKVWQFLAGFLRGNVAVYDGRISPHEELSAFKVAQA